MKASTTLTNAFSKTTNQEILKIISAIFALIAQSAECREDLIINSCIEECVRIYKKVDADDVKLIFVRVLANLSENDLGLNKIKRLGVVNMLQDAIKDCRQKNLLYHFIMAFLLFSKDQELYRLMMKNKLLTMLENVSFSAIKDSENLTALLYGFNLFSKRATESNLSELFLVFIFFISKKQKIIILEFI